MREILFRAKAINRDPNREYRTDYKNGDWVYGLIEKLPFYDENGEKFFEKDCAHMRNISGVSDIDVDENTICEYTSVKDKNDKEVYDGDIIFLEEEHLYGKVCWENLRWYVFWYGWIDKEGLGTVYDIVNENPLSDELLTSEDKIWVAVVGNIYDNPEMLKGENLYDY